VVRHRGFIHAGLSLMIAACFNPTGQTDSDSTSVGPTATSEPMTSTATSSAETTTSTTSATSATSEATTSGTSESTTAGTTGAPASCSEAPIPDDYCAAMDPQAAICDVEAGQCVQCVATEDCGGEGVCDVDARVCVECVEDADCALEAAPACDPGTKSCGCTEHDQCPDTACAIDLGLCFPKEQTAVVYSKASEDPSCSDFMACSVFEPCCSIAAALAKGAAMGKSHVVIRVAPGEGGLADPGLALNDQAIGKSVAILGEDAPLVERSSGAPVIYVNVAATKAYIAGLRLRAGDGAPGAGVSCIGAAAWLDDVIVEALPSGTAFFASVCAMRLRRSAGRGVKRGIWASQGGSVTAVNTTVASVSEFAVRAEGGGSVALVFSTITERTGAPGRLLSCVGAGSTISARNSALLAGPEVGSNACVAASASDSVVTDPLLAARSVVVVQDIEVPSLFVNWMGDDLHVKPGAAPLSEVAVRMAGDPTTDLDREPRPLAIGALDWAGADRP
jgi:hypothetical protein